MDLKVFSNDNLKNICNHLKIKKYNSKNKDQLITLITQQNNYINIVQEYITNNNILHKRQAIKITKEETYDESNNLTDVEIKNNYDIIECKNSYEKDEFYMKTYLSSILNNKNQYKRVCLSPLRYAGGKSKAVGLILENLPKLTHKKIVSPFFGGGSFELCMSQNLGIEVIGYDIFGLLVNFWNVLINHKNDFVCELKKLEVNTEVFNYNRHILLNYWDKIKPKDLHYKTQKKVELTEQDKILLDDDPIKQAVYYYYNMSLSYGPMFLGWPSSNEIIKDKFDRRIKFIEKLNLKNLSVLCSDFEHVIKNHNNDFLFLDPPYYLEGDSKMFKGMYPNCNFAIHHNNFNHLQLCQLLKNHRGGFIITYNNCSTIREWYKDYKLEYPTWQYTYGQGETRIGKNRLNSTKNDNIKDSHEIFIISWPNI